VVAAVGELEKEYGDRVEFRVVSAEETKNKKHELDALHMSHRGHGLVAFTDNGDPAVILAGHQFGADEIRMAILQVASP